MIHQTSTLDGASDRIRSESLSTGDQGDRFEHTILGVLTHDRHYKDGLAWAWMWKDWAGEHPPKDRPGTSQDMGIDIVVYERAGGDLYAESSCATQTQPIEKRSDGVAVVCSGGAVLSDDVLETSYTVNRRAPLEWVVVRCRIAVDNASIIINDPRTEVYIIEVVDHTAYVDIESELIMALQNDFEASENWNTIGLV